MNGPAKKLLVVEDDPGLQSQLRWCFDQYEVLAAADRPSAIAQMRRHEPPVVLQDLGLPPDPAGVSEGLASLIARSSQIAPHAKVIVSHRQRRSRERRQGGRSRCLRFLSEADRYRHL